MAHWPQVRHHGLIHHRDDPSPSLDHSDGLPHSGHRAYTSTKACDNSRVHQGDVIHGTTIHNHYHVASIEHSPSDTQSSNIRRQSSNAITQVGRLEEPRKITPKERQKLENEAFEARQREELQRQQELRAQTYETLADSLRFPRMSARILNIEQATSETCQWVFHHDTYCRWIDDSQLADHHGFMWIKGKPGSGKSTIMKLLHDSAVSNSSESITISYFFNGRASDDLEKSSLGLFRYLVSQILKALPAIKDRFLTRFESKVFNGVVDAWTTTELKAFLSDALFVTQRPPVNIFIDALDEGHMDDVRRLIAYLEQLTVSGIVNNSPLRVCLSSRHYPHITIRKGLPLMLDEEDEHNEDIRKFVCSTLEPEAETLLDAICERAAGVFLWVVLVVPRLNAKMDEGADLNAAKALLRRLPTDLDALFTGVLDRDAEDIDECVELLQWVSFAQTALSPESLYEALRIASGDTSWTSSGLPDEDRLKRYFLHRSRGLLEITRDDHPVVQFIHETVRTFLLTPHGLPRIRPALARNMEGSSHEMLKQVCLTSFVQHQSFYEQTISYLDGKLAYTAEDKSDTDEYESDSDSVLQMLEAAETSSESHRSKSMSKSLSLKVYAVRYIFRHANIAESHGLSQHDLFKVLEEMKLLTILCHCFLLYKSIAKRSRKLFDIRAREKILYNTPVDKDDLIQLVKCMVGTEHGSALFSSALIIACSLQNANIARLIVEGGLKKNHKMAAEIKRYPCFSPTALIPLLQDTIHLGSVDDVRMLLECGIGVDAINPDPNGLGTALQAAVCWNRKDVFEYLASSGADVNQQAGLYGTALQVAAHQGQMDMVITLLKLNASINAQAGLYGTALIAGTYGCQKQVVEVLCKAGADVNIAAGTYGSALQAAAYRGHLSLTIFLLEAGADVNIQGGTYGTALQAAAWSPDASMEIIEVLLTHDAFINARGGMYGSALHAASMRASFEIMSVEGTAQKHDRSSCHAADRQACKIAAVQAFLCRGATITAEDWREPGLVQVYHELFSFAADSHSNDLINLLLNATDTDGSNDGKATHALYGAALFGNSRQISLLLNHGAKPPAGGIHLHSQDCERWVWNIFAESRQHLTSRFAWLVIHDDGYCRGEENSTSSFIDDFVFNP